VAEQLPPADPGEVDGGLVAGVEEQDHGADELVLGELVAAVDHLGEGGDQVVGRPGPPVPRQPAQVLGELGCRPGRDLARVRGRVDLVHAADLGRPGPQQRPVGLGHAQQVADHGHRQRLGQPGDQVASAGLGQPVDQPVDPAWTGRGAARPSGGERLGHQPAQPGVVGRFAVQHAVADQVPERAQLLGLLGPAHLGVAGHVQVGAAEAAVAQQGVDVGVVGDQPVVAAGVVQDPAGRP
jgi:hypothetical protein